MLRPGHCREGLEAGENRAPWVGCVLIPPGLMAWGGKSDGEGRGEGIGGGGGEGGGTKKGGMFIIILLLLSILSALQ